MDWATIETAPKDGTDIILGHFHGQSGEHFYCMADYWDQDGYWYNYVNYKAVPTHWAPLKTPHTPQESSCEKCGERCDYC